jgi:type VI secretion system secreted protein VgrG
MTYTQENRLITIDTPLGKDVLLLDEFGGSEGLSSLFRFELSLFSEDHNIAFTNIIGKSVTISIMLADGDKRFINGIVSRFSQGRGGDEAGGDPHFSFYTATIVPWLWLLTRTTDSRIFQNLSAPDIVEKIFREKDFSDFKILLQGSYEKRDYCVQYRETDFNFVSRLLEEEGIFYFFEHEDGKHTLVLADRPQGHKPCPNQNSARYEISAGGWLEEDTITALKWSQEIMAGKYTLNDYNFKTPSADLNVEVPSSQHIGPGEREFYDYPGLYTKRSSGDSLSNIRMQEEEAQITSLTGSSSCRAFASGYRFLLQDYYRQDMNDKEYVLTSIQHQASQGGGYVSQDAGYEFNYQNDFNCMPFDVPYRPPRNTLRPLVHGTQTAIVVGPAGEEIYTDEHGRIKVQFHWDREGKNDDKSSCWMRVGQLWAAGGWGALFIPRIGQEVIVDFLEGDPDRPIVIGCVYHGTNKPPYSLPADKTKSTIKSNSSLGGGGFNEFRFEDKKGREEIFLHGQKDWTILIEHDKNQTVGNDETLSVGRNRDKTVGVNQSETIGVNKTIAVGANHTETIGGNMTQTVSLAKAETIILAKALTIGAGYQVSVGAAMNETIGAAKMEEIGAAKVVAVGLNSSEAVGVNKSITVGSNLKESVGKNQTVSIAKNLSENIGGKHTEEVTKEYSLHAKKVTIVADDMIELETGQAKIVMKKSGDIKISGKKIEISATQEIKMDAMKITSEAQTTSITKGAMVTVEASGINTIKGSLVKIN